MSTTNNYIQFLRTLSLTEYNYNILYVEKQGCFMRLINRIIFIICDLTPLLRGCCLREAKGTISIHDEYKAMRGYALAKDALCAKQAGSVNLFVLAYFARRAQLSSLDPALLSQALVQDLQTADVDHKIILEIQEKTNRVSSALSTSSALLAKELMHAYCQRDKNSEAIDTQIDYYLGVVQEHLSLENLAPKELHLHLYRHIHDELHQAFYADTRNKKSSLPIWSKQFRNLMHCIIQKIPIHEAISPHELFPFLIDYTESITPIGLTDLFSASHQKPLSRFLVRTRIILECYGSFYRAICMRIDPASSLYQRAQQFALVALRDILIKTAHNHLDSYQAWLNSKKETREATACSLANDEIEQVAKILPLFICFESLTKEECRKACLFMNQILFTSRGNPSLEDDLPLILFFDEIKGIAQIVIALPIDTTVLSEEEGRALKNLQEWEKDSYTSILIDIPEHIAREIFALRRILVDEPLPTLTAEDHQMIASLISHMEKLQNPST